MLPLHLLLSIIIMAFVLTVELNFRNKVKPDGHEYTEKQNLVLLSLLCLVPVVNFILLVFYIAKFVIIQQIDKELREEA